jgi:hypothetical protein
MARDKALFYECNKCGDSIFADTGGKLKFCTCGSLGIDGNFHITRILGSQYAKITYSDEYLCVYKIKQTSTGLYFAGRGDFTKRGKVYTRVPSLNWVRNYRNCTIETFYLLKPSQLTKIANGKSS